MSELSRHLRLAVDRRYGLRSLTLKRSIEDSWREIEPYLDEALERTGDARQAWLEDLGKSAPEVAARVRGYLQQLAELNDREFLSSGPASLLMGANLAGQTFGSYTIDQPIGHGGMGTVWLAHRSDGRFEGQAAVKLLNAALVGHPSEGRFAREGSVLARLQHPNIAHLLDAGVADGSQPYLVLEYVSGSNIDVYCEQHRLDVNGRITLFLDVLAAVAHAHRNLIVHRDLKPSNILVTGEGAVKLLDFGVAALLSEDGESATRLTGHIAPGLTPGYAAPEQLLGNAVTTATDVYALGAVLFELLAGKHPSLCKGEVRTAAELLQLTLDVEAPRLSDAAVDARLRRTFRGDLDNIVAAALRRDPSERYATVELFAQDLRRYLAQEPVSARPRSFGYVAAKFVRRNRAAVASATVVAMALIVTGAIAVWQMIEANRQRQAAEEQASRAESTRDLLEFALTDAGTSGRAFTTSELLVRAEKYIRVSNGAADSRLATEQLIDLSQLFADLGQNRKALELIEGAHRRAINGNYSDLRHRSACELGRLFHYAGRIEDSAALLNATVAELKQEAPNSPALIDCLKQQSDLYLTQQNPAAGIQTAEQSVELAQKLFPRSKLRQVSSRIGLATAHRAAGDLKMADGMYRETADLLKDLGRERTADAVLLYSNWGSLRSDIGDIAGGVKLIEVALEIGSALRPDSAPDQFVNASYARRLVLLDRLDEAEKHFTQTRFMSDSEGDADMEGIALLGLASVARERGDIEAARAALDNAGKFIDAHFPAQHPARDTFLFESGLLRLASRSFAEAKPLLERVIAGYARTNTHLPNQIIALAGIAEAELALGNNRVAAARAAEASVMAGQFAVPGEPSYWVGYCLIVQADVEQALGNTASARAFAAKALLQLTPTVGLAHRVTKHAVAIAALS